MPALNTFILNGPLFADWVLQASQSQAINAGSPGKPLALAPF